MTQELTNDYKGEFVYEPSEYLALAVTVKAHFPDPCEEDYNNVTARWTNQFHIGVLPPYFEKDKLNKLHMHTIIYVKKNFYKRRLQTTNYHVYTRDIFNLEGWSKYCSKSMHPTNPILLSLEEQRRAIDNRNYIP